MSARTLTFPARDGVELFAALEVPTRTRALAVIVHGLCEHQGRYDYLAARLVARQFAVFRFDHRGHGRSAGRDVFYSDFNEIVDDTQDALTVAKQQVPEVPAYVIGHSMGGYAATLLGTKYPGAADGIVLSGALTRYHHQLVGPLPIDAPPLTYLDNELGDGVCSDPAVAQTYLADPYVRKQISVGLLNTIADGVAYLTSNAAAFTDPVLIMHGADDGLVASQDSLDLFAQISSTDKKLVVYPVMMHEIFNEFRKDEVIADTLAWLDARI